MVTGRAVLISEQQLGHDKKLWLGRERGEESVTLV